MDFGITIVIRETFNFVMVHLKKKFNNVALKFFFFFLIYLRCSRIKIPTCFLFGKLGEKGEAEDAQELKYLQNTMAFEDTVPTEYAFETQIVNLAGETQELNIGDETQVLDDPDWIYNMDTQLLDDFDNEVAIDSDSEGEGTDRTEVLDDIDEQSDDGSVRSGSGRLVDEEKVQDTSLHEHDKKGVMEQSDPLADKKQNPGDSLVYLTIMKILFKSNF